MAFDRGRPSRLLILPALFDEANKLRRQSVETMRRLDAAGIDSFLPDLPGCNESLRPLESQTLTGWREAAWAAAEHFDATHLLAIRAGALLAPPGLPGWRYAPFSGASALRGMLRARVIAAREAGRSEKLEDLQAAGRTQGIDLAGYRIGPELFVELEQARVQESDKLADIAQDDIGGSGLWLRAEPDEAPSQADALAAIVTAGIAA